jgi:hypothetical protein
MQCIGLRGANTRKELSVTSEMTARIVETVEVPLGTTKMTSGSLGTIKMTTESLGTLKTTSGSFVTTKLTPGSLGTINMTLGMLERAGKRIGTVCRSSESIDWTQDALATAKTVLGTWNIRTDRSNVRNDEKWETAINAVFQKKLLIFLLQRCIHLPLY